eukprot:3106740-Pleurochrysis_carterae.AAC.1
MHTSGDLRACVAILRLANRLLPSHPASHRWRHAAMVRGWVSSLLSSIKCSSIITESYTLNHNMNHTYY